MTRQHAVIFDTKTLLLGYSYLTYVSQTILPGPPAVQGAGPLQVAQS